MSMGDLCEQSRLKTSSYVSLGTTFTRLLSQHLQRFQCRSVPPTSTMLAFYPEGDLTRPQKLQTVPDPIYTHDKVRYL